MAIKNRLLCSICASFRAMTSSDVGRFGTSVSKSRIPVARGVTNTVSIKYNAALRHHNGASLLRARHTARPSATANC
jgi:hypothetical protein